MNIKRTIFSNDRLYRYTLWREWANGGQDFVTFVGLNPSTADESINDPTIRRCIGFAKSWGYDGLLMMNLFAFRATDPKEMKRQPDPVGGLNDVYLDSAAEQSGVIVAAWGSNGRHHGRDAQVIKLFGDNLHCLGVTKNGDPRHPLYIRANMRPVKFEVPQK